MIVFATRRRVRTGIDIWPGYVDALSALLMLVIFALLIFTLAQLFLSQILSTKDTELADLNARLAEISSLLDLEKEKSQELSTRLDTLGKEYNISLETGFELTGEVERLTAVTAADKEKIRIQLSTITSLQQDIAALRELREQLEADIGGMTSSLSRSEGEIGVLRDRTKALQAQLAAAEERTLLAQQSISEKEIRIDELINTVAVGKTALADEQARSVQATTTIETLNQQISALRQQLLAIGQALKLAKTKNQDQEIKLENLGKRLNLLLAQRVNELEKYRSEFFGRLRDLLGDNPNIRVVGDRFLFQSELLFASGSAQLGEEGRPELAKLAATLRQVAAKIPKDINWVLRVDGHTDRRSISTERFASNWELSTARAVSVVSYLAAQGISPQRLAATGFGEFHPIDQADTPEALQRNRRIEIKLTDL